MELCPNFFFFINFFHLTLNNTPHTASQLTQADWGSGCVGASGPCGFVCGLFVRVLAGGVRGLPTVLFLAPVCPGGERTASVLRRMLHL